MKRKWAAGILALLLCGGCTGVFAETAVNGLQASYTLRLEGKADKEVRGILMVPLREAAEQLGFAVTWEEGAAVVAGESLQTKVTPGVDSYAISSGGAELETFSLGVPPLLSNGMLYVPISFFQPLLTEEGKVLTFEGRTLTVSSPGSEAATEENTEIIGTPDPFRNFETLAEAEACAGYGLALPEINAAEILYRAIPGELLEVIYKDGGAEILRVRKGSGVRDVSGDYHSYASIRTVRVGETAARMRGNGETVSLVTWISEGRAYALSSTAPKSVEEMAAFVAVIE